MQIQLRILLQIAQEILPKSPNQIKSQSTTPTNAERQMSEYLKLQLQESGKENYRLRAHNSHLQTQMARYEEMLSKMNSEYEKLLLQNTANDTAIFSLRKELAEVQTTSQLKINELSTQLKVTTKTGLMYRTP